MRGRGKGGERREGKKGTSGRNRKRPQRWEETAGGRVRLKVKSCSGGGGDFWKVLGVGYGGGAASKGDGGGRTEEGAFRAESSSACRA